MVFYNKADTDFRPPYVAGIDRGLHWRPPEEPQEQNGLYYRQKVHPEHAALVTACAKGEQPFSELTVDAYQSWVETGWKAPHGSLHAALRLRDKGMEEVGELDEALEEFFENENAEHLVEETGDNLWISTARSSNAGNIAGDSIKERLYQYLVGTKVLDDHGNLTEPDWYDSVARVAVKRGSPTFGDIGALVADGFVARHSPAMNLYEDEEFSPTAAVSDMLMYTVVASNWNIGQLDKDDSSVVPTPFGYERAAHDVGVLTSETYFRVACIAHFAGRTIAEVVEMNISKLDQRIRDNLVDKTDGVRT